MRIARATSITTTTSSSRSSSQTTLVETTRRPRRRLAIESYSCTAATGVWYYRVDVIAYEDELFSTLLDDIEIDDRSSMSDESASSADSLTGADVVHYSILRRYNDFLQLFEQIRAVVTATEGDATSLPPFPRKEYISPALIGLLWRVSSSKTVLEDRRAKFETLVQWIENHPVARNCAAFVQFLGKPPQTTDGYVSLKEYTSPDWLSSLLQVTQGRKRRYSAGSSAIRSMLERSTSEASGFAGPSRYQRPQAIKVVSSTRVLGKRRNRSAHHSMHAEPPRKKMALPAVTNRDQDPLELQSCREESCSSGRQHRNEVVYR